MSEGHDLTVPVLNTTGRRITINFAATPVVGQLRMQVSYEGIPEGWAFVHVALLDAAKQVAQQWVQSVTPLVIHGNGEMQ
jgi:hypothetical protein